MCERLFGRLSEQINTRPAVFNKNGSVATSDTQTLSKTQSKSATQANTCDWLTTCRVSFQEGSGASGHELNEHSRNDACRSFRASIPPESPVW